MTNLKKRAVEAIIGAMESVESDIEFSGHSAEDYDTLSGAVERLSKALDTASNANI